MAENLAGVLIAGRVAAGALLFRDAVVVDGGEQLGVPLQTDEGELPQGDIEPPVLAAEAQLTAEAGADAGRNLGDFAVTGTTLTHIHQFDAQHNGVHRLHHRSGHVALTELLVRAVDADLGGENLGGALTAKENDPLVKDAQAGDLHRTGRAHKGVGGHPVVVAHIHGVESPVEADGLHIDVHREQFGLAGLDADRPVDGALGVLGGVEAQVFNTVLVGRYSVL